MKDGKHPKLHYPVLFSFFLLLSACTSADNNPNLLPDTGAGVDESELAEDSGGITDPDIAESEPEDVLGGEVETQARPSNLELAYRWAPIHRQDVAVDDNKSPVDGPIF